MSWRKLIGLFLLLLIIFNIALLIIYKDQPASSGTTNDLNNIAWKPDGSYALIVGDYGTILKYEGDRFKKIPSGTNEDLLSVDWQPFGDCALIVGDHGTILKYTEEENISTIKSYIAVPLSGVSWKDKDVAFIVGGIGTVFRWENGNLTLLPLRTTENLQGVAFHPRGDYALIVGGNGTIIKDYGVDRNFTQLTQLTNKYLWSVSWNPFDEYALVVGEAGIVLKCDGTNLTLLSSGTNNWLEAVDWKPDGSIALIVGTQGVALEYDGNGFSNKLSATDRYLSGTAWKKPDGSYALLVGSGGIVRKYPSLGIDPSIIVNIWFGQLFACIGVAFAVGYDLVRSRLKKLESKQIPLKEGVLTESTIGYDRASITYKVKVENSTSFPISDIRIKPLLSKELFVLDAEEKTISLIRANESKTINFSLRPKGGSGNVDIFGNISYYDAGTDKYKEMELRPKSTQIIYPILTAKRVNENEWQRITGRLLEVEETIENLPIPGKECFEAVSDVVKDKNAYLVSSKITEKKGIFRGVAKFYCEDIQDLKYAIQIEVIGAPLKKVHSKLIIKSYAESKESLIGFYYSILEDIEKRLSEVKKDFDLMQHITELTAKIKMHERRERDIYKTHKEFKRLKDKIDGIEKEKIGGDVKTRSLDELNELYKLLAQDLMKHQVVDIKIGEEIVAKELGKKYLSEVQKFNQAYNLLCEAEASRTLEMENLPESGKKALLLVYFNAAEDFLKEKLKELVPTGTTILLGDDYGHINTRKKEWEERWANLPFGSYIHVIKNNRYIFLKNEDQWDEVVESMMHNIRDMRNNIAHPSRKNPSSETVRKMVYNILRELTDVLKDRE